MNRTFVLVGGLALGVGACSNPAPSSDVLGLPDGPALDAGPWDISPRDAGDAGGMDAAPTVPQHVTIARRDTRVVTMEHMMASLEMQHSGEPLAESMGRDLGGYDRFGLPTDLYTEPLADGGTAEPRRDPAGYSAAVESYEYSKYAMNMLAFESTAGVSLAFAPLVNPSGTMGTPARDLLRERVQRYALASHAGVRAESDGGLGTGFVSVPPPTDNPLNTLGFGGFWPTLHPFRSFNPTIRPSTGATRACSLEGGYGASAGMQQTVGDYECGYSTLHLQFRTDPLEVERVITPGASGWAGWKYGLWVINYLELMHDTDGNAVDRVSEAELANVGRERNTVVGQQAGLTDPGAQGTWLGATDLEGLQAAFMIEEVDNQAQHWLSALNTADGTTLSGFGSLTDALAYDYNSPLRWIPSAISVTEVRDESEFPRPTRYAIEQNASSLQGLLGLVGSYAEYHALTDRSNADVGNAQTTRAYFDGDPFPADNQRPDGENTLHDRSLAVIKFALVTLDRLHRDPGTNVLVDTVTFQGATPARGRTVTATSLAQSVIALRLARRSIAGNLTLYSNSTPDTAVTRTALDGTSFRGAPDNATLPARLTALLHAQAEALYTQITTADGNARPGYDVMTRAPTAPEGDLDAHTAAIRGLLEAFLATGESRYRDRAEAVYRRMEAVFYSPRARLWRASRDASAEVVFTPLRFGMLQGALRELYKLVAVAPGREAFAATIENHLARLNKLVLNGWDDRDQDETVDWPSECMLVVDNIPRGGLQMGERALTGELGAVDDAGVPVVDRDQDCVPEIAAALLPGALAAEVRYRISEP